MEIISPKGRKFSSIVQLENYLQQDIERISRKVLEEVAKEVKLLMEDMILEFYSEYTPEYYERTGQLLEAVRKAESKIYKTNGGWKVRIAILDTDAMSQTFATEDGFFNSYLDFTGHATYSGKRYTDWVVDWVDEGNIFGHMGLEFKDRINKLLDEKVNSGILKEMKRAGYNLYR